jgi:riboflavin kinase/FMN adenylyltransferase
LRIFRHHEQLPNPAKGFVVAIGNFDGVHLGHKSVIEHAQSLARDVGASCGVLTFDPHPRRFFEPEAPRFELTPLRSKVRHLDRLGVDYLYVMHFDAEFSSRSAENFIEDVLADGLGIRAAVVGYDFRFGHRRLGTVELIQTMGDDLGFDVHVLDPVLSPSGQVYSSTNIRKFLQNGEPRSASRLLGRSWGVHGTVVRGDGTGEITGFPTANLCLREYLAPQLGVYAVWSGVERGAKIDWFKGIVHIRHEKKIGDSGISFTVHLLDFADHIIGQRLWVALVEFLHPLVEGDDTGRQRQQMITDSSAVRQFFEGLEGPEGEPPRVFIPVTEETTDA